ncbi:MAG: LysR substrate-binding domain-containing protein [Chromatiales bacterium]
MDELTDIVHLGPHSPSSSRATTRSRRAGTGVARTPTYIVGEALQSGTLVTVLDDYPTEPSTLYAVYPHNRYLSPKVRAFVDFLTERFAPPAPWDRGTAVGPDPPLSRTHNYRLQRDQDTRGKNRGST